MESWQALRDGNLLLEWALNLMVLNVSTRKYHRAVRLPEGDLAKARGDGTSKSAVSRRFVALSRKKMKAWLASDLSELDLLVIQIDGLHVGDHVLMAAIGRRWQRRQACPGRGRGGDGEHGRRPGLDRQSPRQGARSDAAAAVHRRWREGTQQKRSETPSVWPPPSSAARFHKGRNIIERLPQHLHASVKKALRQAWDQDDANKAEQLLRNLARRLEHEEPGVSGSILEGLGGDPRRHPPRPAARTPALARLHQHRRERARRGAPGHPQRQTLETRRDGAQMDRRRPAGGPENLPSPQGLSPAAHPPKMLSRNT